MEKYRVRVIPQLEDSDGNAVAVSNHHAANSWAVVMQDEDDVIVVDQDFDDVDEAYFFGDWLVVTYDAEEDFE